jgi:hypothetical protein
MSTNKNITDFLDYYLSLQHSPEYAVLINGKWGSGKTWFIQNYLNKKKESEEQKHKFLYVSLYGMNATNEISEEFYRQLHPVLSSRAMAITGKVFTSLLKSTISLDLKSVGDSNISLSFMDVNDSDIKTIQKESEKSIIILDDLERSHIPGKLLFGFINELVEIKKKKVILIAHEEKLMNNDQSKSDRNSFSYSEIKEKTIAKTFTVQTDIESAYANFVSNCDNGSEEVLTKMKGELLKLHIESGYNNLRLLKYAIHDFDRILPNIPESVLEHNDAFRDFLTNFFIFSFEKNYSPNDLNDLNEYYMTKIMGIGARQVESQNHLFHEKYSGLMWYPEIFPSNIFWSNYLMNGYFLHNDFESLLPGSRYFLNKSTPNWEYLWNYREISDEEFPNVLSKVIDQFENDQLHIPIYPDTNSDHIRTLF